MFDFNIISFNIGIAIGIHLFIIIANIFGAVISFRSYVFDYNKKLHYILHARTILTILDLVCCIFGLLIVLVKDITCDVKQHKILSVLLTIALVIDFVILALNGCGFACFTSKKSKNDEINLDIIKDDDSEYIPLNESEKFTNCMKKLCCSFTWENSSWNNGEVGKVFDDMGTLISILMHNHLDGKSIDLSPSDFYVGLNLLRMLQKHYGYQDILLYQPLNRNYMFNQTIIKQLTYDNSVSTSKGNINYTTKLMNNSIEYGSNTSLNIDKESCQTLLYKGCQPKLNESEINDISNAKYYYKYALGSYGIPVYTLEYPCGICCAVPCCIPTGLDADKIIGKVWCKYSSIKVFLRRTGLNGCDMLYISQASGLHQCTYFVGIDHVKKMLIIALRGTESISDAATDVNCIPTKLIEVDESCYAHNGMTETARAVFKQINSNQDIQEFLRDNKDYGIIISGHSLGAGVGTILQLLLLHSKNTNYKRYMHTYGYGPPPVIDIVYAKKINMSKYITNIVYNKDVVPRLSWDSIVKTKLSVMRLLKECDKTSWWVYKKSLKYNEDTVIDALKKTCNYVKQNITSVNDVEIKVDLSKSSIINEDFKDDSSNNDSGGSGHLERSLKMAINNFKKDVNKDLKNVSYTTSKRNLFGPSLWNTKCAHLGNVYHITRNGMMENKKSKGICRHVLSAMKNCCICKSCYESNDEYIVYQANPYSFNDILVSSRMLMDHMPHIYKNALNNINVDSIQDCSHPQNSYISVKSQHNY